MVPTKNQVCPNCWTRFVFVQLLYYLPYLAEIRPRSNILDELIHVFQNIDAFKVFRLKAMDMTQGAFQIPEWFQHDRYSNFCIRGKDCTFDNDFSFINDTVVPEEVYFFCAQILNFLKYFPTNGGGLFCGGRCKDFLGTSLNIGFIAPCACAWLTPCTKRPATSVSLHWNNLEHHMRHRTHHIVGERNFCRI